MKKEGRNVKPDDASLHLWTQQPCLAFEQWQRATTHSAGYVYAEQSVRQHCAMWHRFIAYAGTHRLDHLRVESDRIAGFLDGLMAKDGRPAADSTRHRYLKLLSATFDYLIEAGLRGGENPCASLMKYYRPVPDGAPAALAKEEDGFVQIVLAQPVRGWRDYRDQAMLVLIIGSGLYARETINLRTDDLVLDASPPYIHVPGHGKVPERMAPIAPFAREPLERWLEVRRKLPLADESIVFVSGKGGRMLPATLYRKVKAVLKPHNDRLRPKGGLGPQVLRNSFLARQLAKNKPIDVVQQWAGHVEIKSTLRFRQLVVNPRGIEAE